MARHKVDVRREEILAATVARIEQSGLARTRVADVAEALGISTGLVFYHFGSKEALLVAAFEHAVEQDLVRLEAALAESAEPLERLRRVVRIYGPTGFAPGWRIWIDAWALALREEPIRASLRRLDDRWGAVLRDVVEQGAASGAFRVADPSGTVARISALLDGLSVATLVYGSVTRDQLRQWIGGALSVELGVPPDTLS